VPNSFEENDCENANTRAQGGDHMVVLAQAQRDLGIFEEMKRLFSIAPKVGRSGEVTRVFLAEKHSTDAGLRGDRCCPQCLSAYPRCRSAQEEETDAAWLSD
jgi:hypothetical protein